MIVKKTKTYNFSYTSGFKMSFTFALTR